MSGTDGDAWRCAYLLIRIPVFLALARVRRLHRWQRGDLLRRHDAGGPDIDRAALAYASPCGSRRLLCAAVFVDDALLDASHDRNTVHGALGVIPILGNRGRVANSVTLTELSQMF